MLDQDFLTTDVMAEALESVTSFEAADHFADDPTPMDDELEDRGLMFVNILPDPQAVNDLSDDQLTKLHKFESLAGRMVSESVHLVPAGAESSP